MTMVSSDGCHWHYSDCESGLNWTCFDKTAGSLHAYLISKDRINLNMVTVRSSDI